MKHKKGKMPSKNIKKHYSDALYWAISPMSKYKDYHLTRSDESILRKLIHYSFNNEKITYSNKIIGEHTFLKESTLKKAIPCLNKKGLISVGVTKFFDNGEFKTRRTIFIKWEKLEYILSDISTNKVEEKKDDTNVEGNDIQTLQENSIKEGESDEIPKTLEQVDKEIPEVYLDQEKIMWLIDDFKKKGEMKRKEEIKRLDNKELLNLLYDDGVWNIKYDNDGSVIEMENLYGIRKTIMDNDVFNTKYIYPIIDINENFDLINFELSVMNNDIEFKDITLEMFNDIKENKYSDTLPF